MQRVLSVTYYGGCLEAHFTGEANEDTRERPDLNSHLLAFSPVGCELLEGRAGLIEPRMSITEPTPGAQ